MKTPTRQILLAAVLGLVVLEGCDPNPNGPTFPTVPTAKDEGAAIDSAGAKKKGRKPGPSAVISDPR